MTDPKPANDRTRTTIYVAIVGIVALAVSGVAIQPDSTIQILGFCGVAVTGLFAHLSSLNTAEAVQSKVEEVKTDLQASTANADAKTEAMADVLDKVHTLTNNSMQLALTSIADLARWKANQTMDERDEQAAVKAETALSAHIGKQSAVDAGHKQQGTETHE